MSSCWSHVRDDQGCRSLIPRVSWDPCPSKINICWRSGPQFFTDTSSNHLVKPLFSNLVIYPTIFLEWPEAVGRGFSYIVALYWPSCLPLMMTIGGTACPTALTQANTVTFVDSEDVREKTHRSPFSASTFTGECSKLNINGRDVRNDILKGLEVVGNYLRIQHTRPNRRKRLRFP